MAESQGKFEISPKLFALLSEELELAATSISEHFYPLYFKLSIFGTIFLRVFKTYIVIAAVSFGRLLEILEQTSSEDILLFLCLHWRISFFSLPLFLISLIFFTTKFVKLHHVTIHKIPLREAIKIGFSSSCSIVERVKEVDKCGNYDIALPPPFAY